MTNHSVHCREDIPFSEVSKCSIAGIATSGILQSVLYERLSLSRRVLYWRFHRYGYYGNLRNIISYSKAPIPEGGYKPIQWGQLEVSFSNHSSPSPVFDHIKNVMWSCSFIWPPFIQWNNKLPKKFGYLLPPVACTFIVVHVPLLLGVIYARTIYNALHQWPPSLLMLTPIS